MVLMKMVSSTTTRLSDLLRSTSPSLSLQVLQLTAEQLILPSSERQQMPVALYLWLISLTLQDLLLQVFIPARSLMQMLLQQQLTRLSEDPEEDLFSGTRLHRISTSSTRLYSPESRAALLST